jgi:hypothetical protein
MVAPAGPFPLRQARYLGQRLGHLSRYAAVDLLEEESLDASAIPSGAVLWAFKKAYKHAGGQPDHWDSFVVPRLTVRSCGDPQARAQAAARVDAARARLEASVEKEMPRVLAQLPSSLRPGPEPPRLGDILIESGIITGRELGLVLTEQRKSGGRIGELLVHLGIASADDIAEALARQAGVTRVDLGTFPLDKPTVQRLSADFCAKYCLVPLLFRAGFMTVAMAYPGDFRAYREARKALGDLPVRVVAAPERDILELVARCHHIEAAGVSASFVGDGRVEARRS